MKKTYVPTFLLSIYYNELEKKSIYFYFNYKNTEKYSSLLLTHEKYSSIIMAGGDKVIYTLKELRAKKEWSQEDVAKQLGITTATYNSWENNFGKIKISYGNAIANLFGVTLDDIFFTPSLENNSSGERR
ncbi:MAG: helix-turn-helix transcriptional regulator [[Clostridium] innocuum]|nr:helix-turn-helix transcriptional regulator [[Clostridium] innocuum]